VQTTEEIPDEEWMLCGKCGRVLEKYDQALARRHRPKPGIGTRYTWVHPYDVRTAGEDHRPEPVMRKDMDPAAISERCDFCLVPDPAWVLPVDNFQEPFSASVETPGDTVMMSHSDWTACNDCAELIRKGYWDRLTKRAVKAYKDRHAGQPIPDTVEMLMRLLYRQVSRHVKGPLQPRGDRRS
jgi:hypothetical protein